MNVKQKIVTNMFRMFFFLIVTKYIILSLHPSNIFLTEKNKIKVGDFGLVKRINHDLEEILNEDDEKHTSGVGTYPYISPECMEGRPYSYPVDVYAAGVIWVELLSYFSTENERSTILNNIRKGMFPIDFPQKYPMEYDIISSMVDVNPDARPDAGLAFIQYEQMCMHNMLMNDEEDLVLQQINTR